MKPMRTTTYRLAKMDCPSEERLVRMKLDGLEGVGALAFDLAARTVAVTHATDEQEILQRLASLNFDASLVGSAEAAAPAIPATDAGQAGVLKQVLAINAIFFVVELVAGLFAGSMGLVADSLDMLADAIVYALALLAVGLAAAHKRSVAAVSGYLQFGLAFAGLAEVVRRTAVPHEAPNYTAMIGISALALAANALSLVLLRRRQSDEAHMQASVIFTSNDVLANLGVIAAGALVLATGTRWPDLVVGVGIFLLVARGALRILKLAQPPSTPAR
jgi:Co/Zn/Cd efflux system component